MTDISPEANDEKEDVTIDEENVERDDTELLPEQLTR